MDPLSIPPEVSHYWLRTAPKMSLGTFVNWLIRSIYLQHKWAAAYMKMSSYLSFCVVSTLPETRGLGTGRKCGRWHLLDSVHKQTESGSSLSPL